MLADTIGTRSSECSSCSTWPCACRAGVQEQYETAGNTSNLAVEADKRGAGDVLIAAGLASQFDENDETKQRYFARKLGMALLRLHSEWSSAAKPKRPRPEAIEALAAGIKAEDLKAKATAQRAGKPYTSPGSAIARAHAEGERWYANELRILATGLHSRGAVWSQLGPWAVWKGIPPEVVAEALLNWLSPSCPSCDGLGLKKVPNQPALSARQCHPCGGMGKRRPPDAARPVLGYLDDSVQKARNSLKRRLRPVE